MPIGSQVTGSAVVEKTADPSLYTRAEQAFAEALKRDPRQLDALAGQGSLALSRSIAGFAQVLRDEARRHVVARFVPMTVDRRHGFHVGRLAGADHRRADRPADGANGVVHGSFDSIATSSDSARSADASKIY